MSFDRCPHPLYPHDDRHIATLTDDPDHPLTNDNGEQFYLQILEPICQGCGTELSTEPVRRPFKENSRWQSTIPLIEEDLF